MWRNDGNLMKYSFSDAKFMSAKEKGTVLKHWVRFLDSLVAKEHLVDAPVDKYGNVHPIAFHKFAERLYHHLAQHCGFIAHYNRLGFYQEYFSGDLADLQRFFRAFEIEHPTAGGYPSRSCWGDYTDIGKAMCDEYMALKPKIMAGAEDTADKRLALLAEIVERAKSDKGIRDSLLSKIGIAL